jgi:hypothetical protein
MDCNLKTDRRRLKDDQGSLRLRAEMKESAALIQPWRDPPARQVKQAAVPRGDTGQMRCKPPEGKRPARAPVVRSTSAKPKRPRSRISYPLNVKPTIIIMKYTVISLRTAD